MDARGLDSPGVVTGGTHRATWLRRCTIACLAALMGSSLPTALLAQSPSAEPASIPSERIEVHDVVTYTTAFPAGWIAYPEVASTIVDRPEGQRVRLSLIADAPFDEDAVLQEGCQITHRQLDGATVEDVVSTDTVEVLEHGERLTDVPTVEPLELPAGLSRRLEYAVRYLDVEQAHARYYVADATWLHVVSCSGQIAPGDAWWSIAETFELLDA